MQFFRIFLILTPLLILISYDTMGQKQGNVWYFGDQAGVDFNGASPTARTDGQTYIQFSHAEGTSVICDSTGSFLFYTNGEKVWNQNHNVMPNGSNLFGNFSSTHSSLIIPKPDNDRFYYLFTLDGFLNSYNNGLRYSIVDMALDSGRGDIINCKKNIKLLDTASEKMAVTKHANEKDYWLVSHKFYTNSFYAYQISNEGIVDTVVSNAGRVHGSDPFFGIGQMKISPDGSKLALVAGNGLNYKSVFDFNNATGVVNNPVQLPNDRSYGVEFSPDNTKVYFDINDFISPQGLLGIKQYDVTAGGGAQDSIVASESVVASGIGGGGKGFQLAPDGNIYMVSKSNDQYLSAIENPNDTNPNFNSQKVFLGGKDGSFSVPTYITKFTDSLKLDPNHSLELQLYYATVDSQSNVNLEWEWKPDSYFKHFEIWRDNQKDSFQLIGTVQSDSTFKDTTANPSTTEHSYYVIANDTCGSQYQNVSDTDRIIVPKTNNAPCDAKVNLQWNPYDQLPEGSDYYEIYRKKGQQSFNFLQQTVANTAFTDTAVEPGNQYCYRIKGVDAQSGYSSFSDSICYSVNNALQDSVEIDTAICETDSLNFGPQTLTQPGTYTKFFSNASTCGIFKILNLSVDSNYTSKIDTSICQGGTIQFQDSTIRQAGTYQKSYQTNNGCDSLLELDVAYKPNSLKSLDTTICELDSTSFKGFTFNTPGIFRDTLTNLYGCDSIVELVVNEDDPVIENYQTKLCPDETIQYKGFEIADTGQYIDTIENFQSCGKIMKVEADFYPTYKTTVDTSLCLNDTLQISGIQVTDTGRFVSRLSSVEGCDSIVQLNVKKEKNYETILDTIRLCQGETVQYKGLEIADSGQYIDTIENFQTCGKVRKVQANYDPAYEKKIDTAICPSDTFQLAGFQVTDSGAYINRYSSKDGCDSLYKVNVSQYASDFTKLDTTLIEGDSLKFDNKWIQKEGTYLDTLANKQGCDSIISLSVALKPHESDDEADNSIRIPNVFTPNGDGKNDQFIVKGLEPGIDYYITIYNKWGQVVYDYVGDQIEWDGYTKKGEPAASGTYYYTFKAPEFKRTGTITLIR